MFDSAAYGPSPHSGSAPNRGKLRDRRNQVVGSGRESFQTTVTAAGLGINLRGREYATEMLRLNTSRTFTLDGVRYEGNLLLRRRGNQLEFVNELPMEAYVAGVIANEAAPNSAPATYRAQAVTARTYAYIRGDGI